MNRSRVVVFLAVLMIASLWAFREWQINASLARVSGGIGPDVIVGDIPDIRRWGAVGSEQSFTIATTSCNIGDARLDWISSSNVHPVISQNMYRVNNGRIEQIGMSWLKHGFAVAAGDLCGTCTDPSGSYLGVNCSDPYSAWLNGSQGGLGPRSEVNATTGFFLYPHGDLPQFGTADGRIRVHNNELNPALNSGARYFVESQYIHPQDAASGNDDNNASYREAFVSNAGGGNWDINVSGGTPTVREASAILAWQAVYPDVELYTVDIPGDGRVIIGMRTVQAESGLGYHTEIAVANVNSHQSVRSVKLTYGSNSISNPGFNDVDYQFEPYDGTDWTPVVSGNEIEWSTDTWAQSQNANALRWNTLYSYWCDSTSCPTQLTLGLFRPGVVDEVSVELVTPSVALGHKMLDGSVGGGSYADAHTSNDQYLELDPNPTKNPRKQKIDWVMVSESPTATPKVLNFRLESVMNGGPSGDVEQVIQLYNFDNNTFEIVDVRPAADSEEVIEISPGGDLGRFVQVGTNEIIAQVTWESPNFKGKPFSWFIDVDQVVWVID